MEKRLLIDNKSCILVEFTNEEEALGIGYTCWLNKSINEEELNNIIEKKKEVQIFWPKCDIQSAGKMTKILKNLTDNDWEVYAVKILGFGDWKNMSTELDSLQKNDVLFTTKQNRHLIMKKSFDDSEYDTNNKTNKSIKKLESISVRNSESESDGSIMSEEKPIIKKSKLQLQSNIEILTLENKKLKKELAHYKDISLARNEATDLLVNLQSSRTVLNEIHSMCSACHNVQMNTLQVNDDDYNLHDSSDDPKNILNDIENIENIESNNNETKNNENSENLVDLGYGVKINQNILEKVGKQNDRYLLLDLLNALYTKADFVSCSRSGKRGKSSKEPKPELDTNKQKAIMDCAVTIMPEKKKEEIEVLLKKIIENKCKNTEKKNKLTE